MKQKHRTLKKALDLRHNLQMSYREIGLILSLSKSRAYNLINRPLRRITRPLRRKYYSSVNDIPIDVSSVVHMSHDGKSTRTIAYLLGIPKTRVWMILKKYRSVDKPPLTKKKN